MSIPDRSTYTTFSAEETQELGFSLAKTLYHPDTAILLHGDLGTGKTTFTKGLAKGLGIRETVTSPTYAVEQRYGKTLLHTDLFRINAEDASELVRAHDDFPGVRVIEWAGRSGEKHDMPHRIEIECREEEEEGGGGENTRVFDITFHDVRIPSPEEIQAWQSDLLLPAHIIRHMEEVCELSEKSAEYLVSRKRAVRMEALRSAALLHDLLRFTDFSEEEMAQETRGVWRECLRKYGKPHEKAAQAYLTEHGYPSVGAIVEPHGMGIIERWESATVEQLILSYADKRVLHDKRVTLRERFDDFAVRYAHGTTTPLQKQWESIMQKIERMLFPDGPPF